MAKRAKTDEKAASEATGTRQEAQVADAPVADASDTASLSHSVTESLDPDEVLIPEESLDLITLISDAVEQMLAPALGLGNIPGEARDRHPHHDLGPHLTLAELESVLLVDRQPLIDEQIRRVEDVRAQFRQVTERVEQKIREAETVVKRHRMHIRHYETPRRQEILRLLAKSHAVI